MKDIRLVLKISKILSLSSVFNLIILTYILLMASTTEVDELFNFGSRPERIDMISSSLLG